MDKNLFVGNDMPDWNSLTEVYLCYMKDGKVCKYGSKPCIKYEEPFYEVECASHTDGDSKDIIYITKEYKEYFVIFKTIRYDEDSKGTALEAMGCSFSYRNFDDKKISVIFKRGKRVFTFDQNFFTSEGRFKIYATEKGVPLSPKGYEIETEFVDYIDTFHGGICMYLRATGYDDQKDFCDYVLPIFVTEKGVCTEKSFESFTVKQSKDIYV